MDRGGYVEATGPCTAPPGSPWRDSAMLKVFSACQVTVEDLEIHLDDISPSLGSTHRLSLVVPNMEYRDSTSEAIASLTLSFLSDVPILSQEKGVHEMEGMAVMGRPKKGNQAAKRFCPAVQFRGGRGLDTDPWWLTRKR